MQFQSEAVWRAVAAMEKERYTKREIAETLRSCADDIDPDDTVPSFDGTTFGAITSDDDYTISDE